jgi:signal transduction histidine kinase/ActR/RegA family two-component response regulator
MYWEFASISPIVDSAGRITHFLAVKEDITHRKHLEESLRQAQKMESIGVLAGGIAHDFNNILAAIMLHLGLLLGSPLMDKETESALKNLMANAKRAANLTRQLLMFCRKSVLDIKVLDLNDVVSQLLKMMARLIGEHITIRFTPLPGLPAVEADSSMVEQVIMNLALNARDAMPKGGELTIRLFPLQVDAERIRGGFEALPGDFVCLAVSDTGCGMNEATLSRIFEPFFTTKEAGKGTGLGLATVHGIIAQHRGLVEVESAPGKGTTFRVLLPATRSQPPPALQPLGDIRRGSEGILLVEDEASLRRAASMGLRALGYRVLEAEDGPAAIRTWREKSGEVDLLLTDMVMPGEMTGLDLAGRLLMEKPGLKVIISSGYNSDMAGQAMTGTTGVGFLQKPYEIAALARTVRECLDGARTAPAGRG